MSEKKYTGFAALYALDQKSNKKSSRDPLVAHPDVTAKKQNGGQQEAQVSGQQVALVDSMLSTTQPAVDSMLSTAQSSGQQKIQVGGQQIKSRSGDRHQRKHETIRINEDILKRINIFCAQFGITKQEFWETLAVHHFEQFDKKLSTSFDTVVDSMLSHDDMMIFKTHDDIIMRYETYTNQQWTRRDDREGAPYNTIDIRLLEIAFISTIEKKLRGTTGKQPIKSFNYFTNEIDFLIDQQKNGALPANLDEYHRYVLSTWEKRIKPLRDSKWENSLKTSIPKR